MRILFITSTRIGDAVLSSGLMAQLLEAHPEARFTIACGPLAADLFREFPALERLIAMPKHRFGGHWLKLWCQTIGTDWDLVLDLRSSAIAWLLRAKKRRVLTKSAGHRVAAASHVLDLTEPASPKIFVSDGARARASDLVGEGKWLAIGPAANWMGKQWPPERFAQLAARLTASGAPLHGAKILILGGAAERDRIEPLFDALPEDQRVDQVGKLDLLTVYACLERATFYIGNDSGLMHLAAAAGIPTLGLFGPSNEAMYGPWGPHTASVRGRQSFAEMTQGDFDFSGARCHMLDLSVEKVEEAALSLLRRCNPFDHDSGAF